jgi:hypothetical protein
LGQICYLITKVDFMLFKTNDAITNVRITHLIGQVFYNVSRNVDSGITLLRKKERNLQLYPL